MNNPKRCWAPSQKRPIVKLQRIREYIYVFTANNVLTGETYSLIFPVCDTNAMQIFLDGFATTNNAYNNIIIVDQAAWHVTKKLTKFDNIRFIFLPAGSPELNPTEHIWEHIREKYIGNRYYDSIDQFEEEMVLILQDITLDVTTIKKLTGFDWLQYSVC